MRAALPFPPTADRRGFTVLELMMSVAIMTVIVIGLYSVFDATQKALRSTVAQVDVLEGVRATTDLLVRDLESAVPVKRSDTNLTSFAAAVPRFSVVGAAKEPANVGVGLLDLRTNVFLETSLQEVFLVNRQNDQWTAIGYWVGPSSTNHMDDPISVGRLFRFSYTTNAIAFSANDLYERFNSPLRLLNSEFMMDGVVHLRVTAYDANSLPLTVAGTTNFPVNPAWYRDPQQPGTDATAYRFQSLTVPAFPSALELEIGVLEPQSVTRFASIPVASEARKFLARNAGKVHFFRQRIPLRNAPAL